MFKQVLFTLSLAFVFAPSIFGAPADCPNFSGKWKGVCKGPEDSIADTLKMTQTKCESLKSEDDGGVFQLDGREYEVLEGVMVQSTWQTPKGKERPDALKIVVKMVSAGVPVTLEILFKENADKSQVASGKAIRTVRKEDEVVQECTFKKE